MAEIGQRLHNYARGCGVRLDIVEKDYAISYLLAAIANTPGFGNRVALKGGTALKKLYYADYRFSEDLDFSTYPAGNLHNVNALMKQAIKNFNTLLQQRGPFDATYEPLSLKHPHPQGQIAFIVRVRFPYHRQPLCRLKVEITIDEPVLLPLQKRKLLHGFEEALNDAIQSYALLEIVAEKLRALLQSRERVLKRGWGASRVCRDYYDLWEILRREEIDKDTLVRILQPKCAVRNVSFQSSRDFLDPVLQRIASDEWNRQVMPFVPNAPSAQVVLGDLEDRLPGLLD